MVGSLIKNGFAGLGRLSTVLKPFPKNLASPFLMTRQMSYQSSPAVLFRKVGAVKNIPSIGIGARNYAQDQRRKGDEEMLGFLNEEIGTEQKLQRSVSLPTELDGYKITLDKADVTLVKQIGSETVTITINVNHSVDSNYNEEAAATNQSGKEGGDEMRSRPNFDVEIRRGNACISLTCSYIEAGADTEGQEEYNDVFAIDEVGFSSSGDWTDKDYLVAGDILDGYMYDLFMNMLEERGIGSDFVEKLSEFCTDYEHKLYVGLLTELKDFLSKK